MIPEGEGNYPPKNSVPRVGGGDPKNHNTSFKNTRSIGVPRVGGGDPGVYISRKNIEKCSPRRRG